MSEREEMLWDYMVNMGIATPQELGLATALCGTNIGTLESVLHIRTGYATLEQMFEELDEFFEED